MAKAKQARGWPKKKLMRMTKTDFKVVSVALENTWGPYSPDNEGGFAVSWGTKGAGFGAVTFYKDGKGRVRCDNEMMSKRFVKEVLAKLVDDAEFEELGR